MSFRFQRSLTFWAGLVTILICLGLWRDSLIHRRTLWAVCGRGVYAVENSGSALLFTFSPSSHPTGDFSGLLEWQLEREAIPFWRRSRLFPLPLADASDRTALSWGEASEEDGVAARTGLLAPWWLLLVLFISLWAPLLFWIRRGFRSRSAGQSGTQPLLHL